MFPCACVVTFLSLFNRFVAQVHVTCAAQPVYCLFLHVDSSLTAACMDIAVFQKSNDYVTCMVHPVFTQQNICSQWCDQVLCNHSQHIKYAAKCDMGSQFMRGVHGYATQLVFVALVILHMFCERTTRKNDPVELHL